VLAEGIFIIKLMQVAVFGRHIKEQDQVFVSEMLQVLNEEGVSCYILQSLYDELSENTPLETTYELFNSHLEFKIRKFDCAIVLGGDGTILQAITYIRDAPVPILGINLGRMGFLAYVEKKRIREAILLLKSGQYSIDERSMLYLESTPSVFGEIPFALNDFTLLKRDTSSMITINTFVNGDYLNSYWADGIILATPTGSTGYSLSCGGPIIFPNSSSFVLTPVAPHNLNVRPIVISDASVISFEVEGRADHFICTLDSRFELVNAQHQLAIRKNDFPVRLIRFVDTTFLSTMRQKLNWGQDVRN
jgi:NAD+ kinase